MNPAKLPTRSTPPTATTLTDAVGTPDTVSAADRKSWLSLIRDIPDWPKPGVVFKDMTPLFRDADGFAAVISALAAHGRDPAGRSVVDVVAGIEARGFILGAPVAERLGVGFVPIRKAGKLPHATSAASYALEYGEATIEVHRDAFQPGDQVLLIDDVLATGGTASAAVELVRAAGADVSSVAVLLELEFLHGRDRLAGVELATLLAV